MADLNVNIAFIFKMITSYKCCFENYICISIYYIPFPMSINFL